MDNRSLLINNPALIEQYQIMTIRELKRLEEPYSQSYTLHLNTINAIVSAFQNDINSDILNKITWIELNSIRNRLITCNTSSPAQLERVISKCQALKKTRYFYQNIDKEMVYNLNKSILNQNASLAQKIDNIKSNIQLEDGDSAPKDLKKDPDAQKVLAAKNKDLEATNQKMQSVLEATNKELEALAAKNKELEATNQKMQKLVEQIASHACNTWTYDFDKDAMVGPDGNSFGGVCLDYIKKTGKNPLYDAPLGFDQLYPNLALRAISALLIENMDLVDEKNILG